ncbi:MAG: hypothetical protein JWO73_177 [Candidatus Taylorbacteria bacterium]|nr:hypothetical protein [Candidatus Taylorbacteria bacterium]
MKKNIKNVLALFLLAEGAYLLYTFVLVFSKFISTFDSSNAAGWYAYGVYIAEIVLFIVAGIGLWKNHNWAIICGWVALILPQLLKLILPITRLPLQNNYSILIINIAALVYLSVQWGKLKAD